ncbi:hypothetical protein VM1G_06715 [Cytospora mali]|uniref:Uncharacterized protein n=1 Tax=Cytospora mali TaxID=578113 RepID=A0A194W5I9_CYTMA|nr:hypothetical protein VM1G_06715 [Valsa mali]
MTITASSGSITTSGTTATTYAPPVVPTSVSDPDEHSSPNSPSRLRSIGIAAGSAVAGVAAVAGFLAFAWFRRRRLKEKLQGERQSSNQRLSPPPPPVPLKEYHQVLKKKRRSILSWVPSVINSTPAELPATPVPLSARNNQGDGVQPPIAAHRPYPRDSLTLPECYELEARWLPKEVPSRV